ncbi:MAG: cytochrome bc complex cytochrome b subunit [Anaerolineae bacterium]
METTSQAKQKKGLTGYLGDLIPIDWEFIRHASAEPVPYHLKKWWFCLGGTPLYLFIVQVITGIALTFYYVPSPEFAYESVEAITHTIRFGWFIRSIHSWSANLMIVAVILHLLRVFFTGAYRHPRQINWLFGFGLLGITLTFGFTGYSLIFEQMSYWGATVASNLVNTVPLAGSYLRFFMLGGPQIGPNTLTRFYMLHIGVLPTLIILFLGVHVFFIRAHGVKEMHFEGEVIPQEKRFFKFWPDHVMTEIIIGVVLMYLLTILALIFPADLGEPADPNRTPAHIRPEWYFFASFRLLKLLSLRASVLLTLVLGAIAFLWPFIEEQLVNRFKMSEKVPIILGIVAFGGFLTLTVWESLAL